MIKESESTKAKSGFAKEEGKTMSGKAKAGLEGKTTAGKAEAGGEAEKVVGGAVSPWEKGSSGFASSLTIPRGNLVGCYAWMPR